MTSTLSHPLYLVAVSFGPDSMALLDMLQKEGKNLVVCHVNYHKRKESNDEEKALRSYCEERNIPIHVLESPHAPDHVNFQAWARDLRYEFFGKIYQQYQADGIYIAHHADDDVETYFMQKGKLLSSYGISPYRELYGMKVIRPLLSYRKKDLWKYCMDHHIPFSVDSSNLENDYARNRIRHQKVEIASDEEVRTWQKEKDELNKKRKEQLENAKKAYVENGIDIDAFLSLDEECQKICLHDFISRVLPEYSFSKYKYTMVKQALISKKPNWQMSLLSPYVLVKAYRFLYIKRDVEPPTYGYKLVEPCKLKTPFFLLDFTKDTSKFHISLEDYPLYIRNAKPDDVYEIDGKRKALHRAFLDWKMPVDLRKTWPVIVNKDQKIIYVPRYRASYKKKEDEIIHVNSRLGIE